MRVLVCGDRNWADYVAIRRELSKCPRGTVVIEGDCRGADRIAGEVAEALGFEVVRYPANWAAFGRGAGLVRNRQMLMEGKPDVVLAFHADLAASRGTANMLAQARAAGVPVRVLGS